MKHPANDRIEQYGGNPEVAMWRNGMESRNMRFGKLGNKLKSKIKPSTFRHVHLIAMRCYRNLDRRKMSFRSGVPFVVLEFYETTRDCIIPSYVEEVYVESLKLTTLDIRKIKEIVAGERNLEEEKDRDIPATIKSDVWKRDKNKCADCGHGRFLHFHHIKLFSKGGMHTVDNIKLLCVACHAKTHKNDKSYHMLRKMAFDLMGVTV